MAPGPPEYSAVAQPVMLRAAGDVAGADLGRDGGGQRLERAHPVLAGLLPVEGEAAEHMAQPLRKAAHLDEAGADGKVEPGAQQQEQQQQLFVPQHVVHRIDDGVQGLFHDRCFPLSQNSRWMAVKGAQQKSRTRRGAVQLDQRNKQQARRTRKGRAGLYSVLLPERFSVSALHLRSSQRASPEPHPPLVLTLRGRLRVLLLRQACAVFLKVSLVLFGFACCMLPQRRTVVNARRAVSAKALKSGRRGAESLPRRKKGFCFPASCATIKR